MKKMANYPAAMSVSITDAKGQPVTGASVELVTTMIDMDHGEKKSPAKMIAPGIYEGTVNFFMVGPWNVEVRAASGRQSKAQKIRFDVNE
jgi:nitrogen fixation protein FixH